MLIAYDRDEAGDRAAEKLAAQLMSEGLDCYRVLFPKGMDANEYALKVTPAVKSLGVAIRSAQWMGKGKPKPLPAVSVEVAVPDAVHDPAPATPLVAEEAAKEETVADAPRCRHKRCRDPPAPHPAAGVQTPRPRARARDEPSAQRRYRVRGLEKNLSYEVLKVNLMASAPALDGAGEAVHVDTLDLYHARARAAFVEQAADRARRAGSKSSKAISGRLLLALEAEQEKLHHGRARPRAPVAVSIDESARARAMELLKAPDLIERI